MRSWVPPLLPHQPHMKKQHRLVGFSVFQDWPQSYFAGRNQSQTTKTVFDSNQDCWLPRNGKEKHNMYKYSLLSLLNMANPLLVPWFPVVDLLAASIGTASIALLKGLLEVGCLYHQTPFYNSGIPFHCQTSACAGPIPDWIGRLVVHTFKPARERIRYSWGLPCQSCPFPLFPQPETCPTHFSLTLFNPCYAQCFLISASNCSSAGTSPGYTISATYSRVVANMLYRTFATI